MGAGEVGEEMLAAAAEQETATPSEGETTAEAAAEAETPEDKKEEADLLVGSVETLAGDAKTVAVIADELANEKVERIRTKRVRDDKPQK